MTDYLECPRCGDDAAQPDAEGCYYDGQPITCGCVGHVCIDASDCDDVTASVLIQWEAYV